MIYIRIGNCLPFLGSRITKDFGRIRGAHLFNFLNYLVEETRLLEKTIDLQQVTDTLYYHIMLYRVHLASAGFKLNVSGDMH
jgi:hypothetical protein